MMHRMHDRAAAVAYAVVSGYHQHVNDFSRCGESDDERPYTYSGVLTPTERGRHS
jgi:hypothetical protein